MFNPIAKSDLNKDLGPAFCMHESMKKNAYNERIIRVEHGSFTPVILSSYGGFGRESSQFVGKLVEKVAEKKNLEKSVVENTIRKKVSFELVRAQVACTRGSRSLKPVKISMDDAEILESSSSIRGDG